MIACAESRLMYFLYSSYFAFAFSSVSSTMTESIARIFTSSRLRPCSSAAARIRSVTTRVRSGRRALMNTASACLPENCWPRLDAPAWKITGVRCGLGSVREMPGTEKYLPLWPIGWTLEGSA